MSAPGGASGAQERRRYAVGNVAVPPAERDRFRALSGASRKTYRNLKTREPEPGEAGVYALDLTDEEAERLRADPPANLRYLEDDQPLVGHVTAQVPSAAELTAMGAGGLYERGFTGAGIDVGVIDAEGIGAAVLTFFTVKAIRAEGGGSATSGAVNHGSNVASLAVPRASRLVFSRATTTTQSASALYWMADDASASVRAINMSFSNATAPDSAQSDAVANALSKGIKVFVSAGNAGSSTPTYPAALDGVVAVGALDGRGSTARASFSNHGPWVDMWANGRFVVTYDENGNLETDSGTSLSAPLVTHVFASNLSRAGAVGADGTLNAMLDGAAAGPAGGGGGKIVQAEAGARAMPRYCP